MPGVLQRNNVNITGAGKSFMIFAHGFGCDQNAWHRIKSAFTKDYTIVLFDFVGAGKSNLSEYDQEKYASLNGYTTDLIEICDTLKIRDAIFVGHSVSCMVGTLASIKRPELFRRMIFIGPSPCYINSGDYIGGFDRETIDDLMEVMEEDYISWAKSLAPSIINTVNGDELSQELTDSFCSIDPEIGKQFARVTFLSDNRKDLSSIPVDTLTIQCSNDSIAPLEVGKYVNEQVPNNTLKIISANGHCPHMSHPAKTIEVIKEYLLQE